MHKKKLLIIVLILPIILFFSYIYKYQQLVNEGSYLADEHCIKVNPLIIDRKNKYLIQYNIILAGTASTEEFMTSLDKYNQASQVFIDEEKKWLTKQKKYMDRKDFNLIMPSYIKEAALYEYQMYEAEYNSSSYLSQAFKETDKEKQIELSNKVIEETIKSRDAGKKYNDQWDKYEGKTAWIYNFVKVPVSKCPPENNNIPILPDPFAPPVPVSEGETKT